MAAKALPDSVTYSAFADLVGCHRNTVTALVRQKILHPEGKKLPLAKSIQDYIEYQTHGRTAKDITEAKKALYEEQRRKLELENNSTERQLVKLEDAQFVINEGMAILASEFKGLPGRHAGELAGIKDPAIIRQKLREQVTSTLQAAADRLARLGALAAGRGNSPAPAAEKPRSVGKRKKGPAARKRRARTVSK